MKNKYKLILLVTAAIVTLLTVILLAYREWSPGDNSAATIYYISPSGNDTTGNGSQGSPWKTIEKANDSISSGDTVILKNGVYQGEGQAYKKVSKSGTTWRAESEHKAIIDGGFPPSALNGQWSNIKNAADNLCGINGDKANSFRRLFAIEADNVTVDGIFLRNSCGGGFNIQAGSDDISIINSKVDWTFVAGLNIDPEPNQVNKNINILNNEFTRTSFNDVYASFVAGYCSEENPERNYCVNISWHLGGENLTVRDNLIAWGRGEIAITGSKNLIFENNTVIGNKNNFYSGNAHDVVVRNNLFWAPDSQLNPNTHWEKKGNQDNDWHLSSRNEGGEVDNPQNEIIKGLDNVAFYNNLIINNGFEFNGYHAVKGQSRHSDSKHIYVGNNTFVGLPDTNGEPDKNLLFDISFGAKADADGDAEFSGIIENNIFDVSKERGLRFVIGLSGNDKVTLRNNVLPTDVIEEMRGPGDVYTADSVLQNAVAAVNFPIPAVGASTVDVAGLRTAINIDNYRLKNNAEAINSGTTAGGEYGIEIPSLARSQDYFKNSRIGLPDIGAIEYGGVFQSNTPTPIQSATPTPTMNPQESSTPTPIRSVTPSPTRIPGSSPTPTSTPIVQNTPTPTEVIGSVCGKADMDNDGDFDLADFVGFATAYQDGKRTCSDTGVDYGVCEGRDVDRDGRLNITDFGGTNGFASRYYPKTSCAL